MWSGAFCGRRSCFLSATGSAEDRAVDAAVQLQEGAGIDVVTDGEMRRGGYEPIAGRVFRRVAAHRLLLECDDDRSGSFQPLQEVPDDKVVVLGLVTTKSPRREGPDDPRVKLETLAAAPRVLWG